MFKYLCKEVNTPYLLMSLKQNSWQLPNLKKNKGKQKKKRVFCARE